MIMFICFLDNFAFKRNEQFIDCESYNYINKPMIKINLLRQVSASYPHFTYENSDTFIKVPNSLLCSSKDYFIFQFLEDSIDKIYYSSDSP